MMMDAETKGGSSKAGKRVGVGMSATTKNPRCPYDNPAKGKSSVNDRATKNPVK